MADMVPIIRCPRGNAAEMVARRLDAKLRDHIASTSRTRDAYTVDALQRPCKSLSCIQVLTCDSACHYGPKH